MMGLVSLLIVAFGATFAVIWLFSYIPTYKKVPFRNTAWSPKLLVAKILAPLDIGATLILVCGGWIGISSAVGISSMVFNVLTGIGLSLGVLIIKKLFVPRWIKAFEEENLSKKTIPIRFLM